MEPTAILVTCEYKNKNTSEENTFFVIDLQALIITRNPRRIDLIEFSNQDFNNNFQIIHTVYQRSK